MTDYTARMRRAARDAQEAGLSGLVITPGPDLVYFCGYQPTAVTERLTALLIEPDAEPTMVVPRLEVPEAKAAAGSSVELVDWTDGTDPYSVFGAMLHPAGGAYGISDNAWAMHLLGLLNAKPDTRYEALTAAMPMLRAVKDSDELRRLSAAADAADETFQEILHIRFAGRKETAVAADLAEGLRRHGHSQVDFTVVGSGPNGANPHHEAGDRVIAEGDTVVLDFGGLMGGYGSDTTRTVYVGQEPPDEVRKVHDVVRRAQQAAFEAVRPGIACQEIDRVARKVIDDAGYGEYFIHRTGHGIGLTTHEPPYMVEGETQVLVPGMCFSIEPGVYLPGKFGVRIEDIVTVLDDGGLRLNNTSRELATVA